MADGIRNVEALGPADQGSAVDTALAHGETEGEAEIEQILRVALFAPAKLVGFKVLVVVNAQERLNLTGQEEEEILGGTRGHQFPGNEDLRLGEGEGGIAVQEDRAHTEVGATKVNSQVQTLV